MFVVNGSESDSVVLEICPVRFSYNLSFSACFFSQNNVFLPQQISWNSVLSCFFSEANVDFVKI